MAPTCPSVTPNPSPFTLRHSQGLRATPCYCPSVRSPGQSTSQHATVTWPFDHISGEGRSPSRRRAPPASCHHTQACPSTCYCHTLASRIGPSNGRHHRPACHHPTAVRAGPSCPPMWLRCPCQRTSSMSASLRATPPDTMQGRLSLLGSERDSRWGHTDDHNLTLIQTSPRRVLGNVRQSGITHFRFRRAPNRARSLALSPRLECGAAIWLTAASASGLGDSPASASRVARTIGVRHHTQIIFVLLLKLPCIRVGGGLAATQICGSPGFEGCKDATVSTAQRHALGLLKATQPGLPSDLLRVKQRPERSAGSAWTWSLQRLLTWKRTQRTGRSTDK
ncbi:hypothetical protein AAY473_019461 [Plecturocebus cupreus]